MLNPSDANADENDATLRRCLNFAARSAADRGWADHRLAVVNLYGYVTKSPAKLRTAGYALCPVNDRLVLETCKAADLVICGWGKHGTRGKRGEHVRRRLQNHRVRLFHLGPLNKDGTPKHPNRLPDTTPLVEWPP
jgi:hypothetical protein